MICSKLNIDSQKVADITALDTRIGGYGTIHGKAFGGSCLPKDLQAFLAFAQKYQEPELLQAVENINQKMKKSYGER